MKSSFWKNYRFPILLVSGVVVGSILGIVLKEKATVLKPFGDIFINILFTVVVPLIFLSITNSIIQMDNIKRLGKIVASMFVVFIITGLIAATIMIVTVRVFNPAEGFTMPITQVEEPNPPKVSEQLVKMVTVTDFKDLLSISNMLPLIVFSLFFGFSIKLVGEKAQPLIPVINAATLTLMKLVGIIMYYAPIGLGAYFANLVGKFGPELIGTYARACAVYYPAAFLYFFIFLPIYGYIAAGKYGVKSMKYLITPMITSLSTQSSIATLPINLEASKKIGVNEDVRNIVLPIGATAHMDGTCLSGILKIAFLYGVFGMNFTGIDVWVGSIIFVVLAGMANGAIPGGGLISEMLIVSIYGFPPEAFPLIATIGILVDPPATMVNSVGDNVAGMLVSRIVEGKEWFKQKVTQA